LVFCLAERTPNNNSGDESQLAKISSTCILYFGTVELGPQKPEMDCLL
jgi:hypothetical protein